MANALQLTADRTQRAEPISAHPDKLKEQIIDTAGSLDDIHKLATQLEALKAAAQDLAKQPNVDADSVKSAYSTNCCTFLLSDL